MKKTVLIFGLTAGIIVSVWLSVSMFIFSGDYENMELNMAIGFLGMLIAFAFIFVGIKNYRDKMNNGIVSFGKAFAIGFFIALIASLFYVATWAVVYNNFMPDFMEKYSAQMIEQYQSQNLPAAELQAKVDEIKAAAEDYKNPVYFTMWTLMEILPLGIIVSLIAALVLKRKPKMA